MRTLRSAVLLFLLGLVATPISAAPITIDFEDLVEGDLPGGLGVTFSGGIVLTEGLVSGGTLNEGELPPFSGINVAASDTDLQIDFTEGVSSVAAYFTYLNPLSLSAFNAAGGLIGFATSRFDSNLVSTGNPANELMQITSTEAIWHITIGLGSLGGLFVLDDLTFEVAEVGGGGTEPNPVPEPATVTLMLLGAAVAAGRQKLRAWRQAHV